MSPYSRSMLIGAFCAFVLFVLVTMGVTVMAFGVAWLWIFGDDTWPAATDWILPLIGAVAGTMAAAACLFAAHTHGKRRAAERPDVP